MPHHLQQPIQFFGAKISPLTLEETSSCIVGAIEAGSYLTHSVVNVAKLVKMQEDPFLRNSVNSCDIVNADGMGIVWAAKILGWPLFTRVAGIDLMLHLCRVASEHRHKIFLLGGKEEIVKATAQTLVTSYPGLQIGGTHSGYFDDENDVVNMIAASNSQMLFIGISTPLKENFIFRNRNKLNVPFIMGVGGTFDVISGKIRRAPPFLQNIGMEWGFRLIQEPLRLAPRYAKTNMIFAWMVLKALLKPKVLRDGGKMVLLTLIDYLQCH